MKLHTFRNLRINQTTNTAYADVEVQTGFFWWRKTTTKQVFAPCYSTLAHVGNWSFLESGEYTPGMQCERLYRACAARMGLPG